MHPLGPVIGSESKAWIDAGVQDDLPFLYMLDGFNVESYWYRWVLKASLLW